MPNPAREETVLGGEVRRLASCHARHGNASIGKCHQSDGNFERALVLHLQAREISETLGHREGVALASSHLGHCHCSLGDYSAAISSYKTQYAVAIEMHLEEMKTRAALGLGVAMRLQLRADLHVPRVNLGMRVGADVEIHSLSRRPELNGVRGKIIATAYCVL